MSVCAGMLVFSIVAAHINAHRDGGTCTLAPTAFIYLLFNCRPSIAISSCYSPIERGSCCVVFPQIICLPSEDKKGKNNQSEKIRTWVSRRMKKNKNTKNHLIRCRTEKVFRFIWVHSRQMRAHYQHIVAAANHIQSHVADWQKEKGKKQKAK